jgi:hypothetical protein
MPWEQAMNDVEVLPLAVRSLAARPSLRTLAPLGVGTNMVESLSSYVGRLAALHRVSTVQMEKLVNEDGSLLFLDASTQPFRLDAPTAGAHEFGRRLAAQVRDASVERLGLGGLHEIWSPPQSLKATASWCPACLSEMETPYLPLAWSLKTCTVCPKHRIALVDACISCGHKQSVRRVNGAEIGFCGDCGGPLATPAAALPGRPVRCELSALTFELIGDCQIHGAPTVRPDLAMLVITAVDLKHAESAAALSRSAGISKGTLHGALDAASNPTVDVVLRLCAAGRIAPGALFGYRQANDPSSVAAKASTCFLPEQRRQQVHNWDSIRQALFKAMHEDQIPSAAEFAARHGVGLRELKAQWGGMTQSLTMLRKKRQARQEELAIAHTANLIGDAAQAIAIEGFRPTTRRLAERLGIRRESRIFAAALKAFSNRGHHQLHQPEAPMEMAHKPQAMLLEA